MIFWILLLLSGGDEGIITFIVLIDTSSVSITESSTVLAHRQSFRRLSGVQPLPTLQGVPDLFAFEGDGSLMVRTCVWKRVRL